MTAQQCIDCGRPTLGSLVDGRAICWRPCWHRRNPPAGGTFLMFNKERLSQWESVGTWRERHPASGDGAPYANAGGARVSAASNPVGGTT